MISVALRFAENKAPKDGTIAEHVRLIEKNGYVWYGKFGAPLSDKTKQEILSQDDPKILLIRSGRFERYWAHISDISRTAPDQGEYPEYYADFYTKIHAWLKVTRIEEAPKDIMGKCVVASSKRSLSEASKYSMSPYFIIEVEE